MVKRVLAFLFSIAALAMSVAMADSAFARPIVYSVSIEERSGALVLLIDSSEPLEPHIFSLPEPTPRLVLDLPRVEWRLNDARADRGSGRGAGAVRGFRFAHRDEAQSRLVLDLSTPVRAGATKSSRLPSTNGRRLEVVLDEGGEALAGRETAVAPLAVPATPNPVAGRGRARRVVAIDPGHGGKDPGAIGRSGSKEKDITLAAALKLRDSLVRRGYEVVLTREDDRFLPLWDRVRVARAARADLFISLHADAHADPSAKGASIYTLSEGGERRARALADSQNWNLELAEPPKSEAVEDILMDLAQRDSRNRSAEFAQVVIDKLEPVAPLLRNTHRNAGFFVLLAPDLPAVLIELGFMTNEEDEARLQTPAARRGMVDAIADAIDAHFKDGATMAAG